MQFKKIIALILAAQMLLVSAVSCGDNEKDPPETKAPVETGEVTETDPVEGDPAGTKFDRASVSDDLPNITFNGRDFRILAGEGTGTQEGDFLAQYEYDEDLLGDPLNDAIWQRNEDVEKRFDVKIKAITAYGEAQDTFTQAVFTNDDMFDVCDMMQYMSWVPMIYNCAVDWNEITNINWEKPWWNKATNDEATVLGKTYVVTGDLSLTSLTYMWIQAFNMDLLEDWGYTAEDMYQLVFDGKWTLDKFIEICSGINRDLNGDSTPDMGDMYGYATCTFSGTDPWLASIDARILSKDDEGYLTVTLGEEKVYNTLEKLINFFFNSKGCFQNPDSDLISGMPEFADGTVAIYPSQFVNCIDEYADLSFDYGILPYPKYDETQTDYVTGALDQLSVYSIPVTLPLDTYDFVGIMMEAMNAESYKTVYPAYFDGALKGRYSTDENMSKVVELIVDGRMFDLAYMYGIYMERLPYQFRYCFRDHTTDLASKLAKNKDKMDLAIEDLMYYYETGEQVWYG